MLWVGDVSSAVGCGESSPELLVPPVATGGFFLRSFFSGVLCVGDAGSTVWCGGETVYGGKLGPFVSCIWVAKFCDLALSSVVLSYSCKLLNVAQRGVWCADLTGVVLSRESVELGIVLGGVPFCSS